MEKIRKEILGKRKKLSIRGLVTAIVVILALMSAFCYRTSYYVFFLGEDMDFASEQIDNDTEIRIEVKNNQRITLKDMSFRFVLNGVKNFADGKIQVEVKNAQEEVIGEEYIHAEMLLRESVKIRFEDVPEIRGDFVICLRGKNFEEQKYPSIAMTCQRDITDRSDLKGITYQNGVEVTGQPVIAFGTTLRDNLYFPALALLAGLLLLLNVCAAIRRNGYLQKCFGECRKTKLLSFLLIGGYLMYELWTNNAGELCSWIGPWYVLDYGVGMGSRLFIGSVMKILFYDIFLDKSIAFYFVMAVLSILVLEIAYLLAECITSAREECKRGIAVIVLFYLASPGSVGYLWNSANMGRMEMYLFVLALSAVFVNVTVKNRLIRYTLLVLLSICMFAIHQGNLFTYFPVIFMLCIYNVFKEHRISWKDFWGGFAVGIISAATFIYFHFFSYVKFETMDEMVDYVEHRTNLRNNVSGIHMEYFSGEYGMFDNCFAFDNYRICGILQLIVLWPLVAMGFYIGVNAIKYWKAKHIKWIYLPYLYLFLFNLIYIPVFTFECDWARWFAAIITTKTIECLYLFYVKEEGIVFAVERLSSWLKNKEWCVVFVLFYLASLEKFGSAKFLTVVEQLYERLFPFVV